MKLLSLLCATIVFAQGGNAINKSDFNFGHQLGYIYSATDSAYFAKAGTITLTTGLSAFYTPVMPLVENPEFKKRLIVMVPLYLEIVPCNGLAIQFEVTDLFVEYPYNDIHNIGGKSPRFKTKMAILKESNYRPALSLTLGVKFSSAKPYTIWDKKHNYQESNGLAGAGTGEADYLIQLAASKRLGQTISIHGRLGLAPLGSPVEYVRGSGQADEIPYGAALEKKISSSWSALCGLWGMYNGLSSTTLAHYSVGRMELVRNLSRSSIIIRLERGLTAESDQYNASFVYRYLINRQPW